MFSKQKILFYGAKSGEKETLVKKGKYIYGRLARGGKSEEFPLVLDKIQWEF